MALKSDGTVFTWAVNGTPAPVNGLTNIKAIAAGGYHSMALKKDGKVYAWGEGQDGQLGHGQYASSEAPVQVYDLTGITDSAAGQVHYLALHHNGTIYAWVIINMGRLVIEPVPAARCRNRWQG